CIAEPLALELQGARGNQLLAYRRTPIARVPGRRQRSVRHRLDMDLDVDTVEQWPRDALLVFAHLLGRAAALAARVAEPAAAAQVHCRDQLEAGRVAALVRDPGDMHLAGLQRFAQ